MKRLLPALLAALCVAGPARADDASMVFGKENTISSSYDALEEVWFLLRPDGDCAKAWVDWEQGSTRVRVPLAYYGDLSFINDGLPGYGYPSGWAARLPVNHAGTATCSYTTVGSDGVPVLHENVHSYEIVENYTDSAALNPLRYPDFSTWDKNDPDGVVNEYWYVSPAQKITVPSVPQAIRLQPAYPANPEGGYIQTMEQFDESGEMVEEGYTLGSVWFKARTSASHQGNGTLVLERGHIDYDIFDYVWTTIAEISVPTMVVAEWFQFHLIVQADDKEVIRIRNTTEVASLSEASSGTIDLCDIVLTPIIPDVKIFRDDVDYSPGFPSTEDPVTFRIAVSNLFEGAQAEFITPRLVWRQGEDDEWHDAMMTNIDATAAGRPGGYACVLCHDEGTPDEYRIDDGPFEYFYEVSFAGYTPRFPALKYPRNQYVNDIRNFEYGNRNRYPYLIHTNDWAMLTDAGGTNSECRSPAYYPDFSVRAANRDVEGAGHYTPFSLSLDVVDDSPAGYAQSGSDWGFTHLFDIRNLYGGWPVDREVCYMTHVADNITAYPNRPITIAADFPYLMLRAKDGVRRFRSLYTDLAAVTADWSTNVQSHLLPAYPMQHVGDYTWQAIIHVTNYIDAAFSVTGALHAAEGGYDEGPFEWLEINQDETDINPPMSGAMTVESAGGVLVTNHHELVRFQTYLTNRTETVTETVTTTTYEPASCTGTFVGVVIDPNFYGDNNPEGDEHVDPTIDDVGFWFERLEEGVFEVDDYEDGVWVGSHEETGYVARAVSANYYTNAAGLWGPQYVLHDDDQVRDGDENEIYPYVYPTAGFVPYVFTNETTVVTGLVENSTSTITEHTVTHWFHAPREGDILAANGGVEPRRVRTEVDINYDGFLMYRFCTTNGSYQIRRAAWQDFNEWQADDKRYSRSAGLYDMKTFSWDLEGEQVTSFDEKRIYTRDAAFDKKALTNAAIRRAAALADHQPPNVAGWMYAPGSTQPAPWTEADGGDFYGYLGRRAQLFLERTGRNATSADPNGAFLLDARPSSKGSLETTSVSTDDGRDTLTMRVRSFSDDDRCITYTGGSGSADPASSTEARNYRVVARLMNQDSDQVSDGEHSLSLIGFYQDAGDFWEARITQKSSLTGQSGGKPPLEKDWFEVHVYKWVDGTPTEVYGRVYHDGMGRGNSMNASMDANNRTGPNRVAQWPLWNNNDNVGGNGQAKEDGRERFISKTGNGWTFVFDLQNEGADKVRPAVYAFLQDNYSTFDTNKNCYAYRCESTSGGTTYGRPGYNTKDCGLQIAPYVYGGFDGAELTALRNKNGSGGSMWGAVPTSTDASWDHNKGRDYDSSHRIDVWKAVAQGTPSIIERKAPTVHYRVDVYRTGLERIPEEGMPVAPVNGSTELWDEEWDAYHAASGRTDGVQSVASWKWQEVSFPMNFWDDTFVRVRALADDGDGSPSLALLAVDDLECVKWRGLTLKNPEDNEGDDEISWIANYAAIEYDGVHNEGRKLQLDRTRANPTRTSESMAQGVASPLLENGIGDVSFTYTVDKYPVRVRVGVLDRVGMFTTFADEELPVTAKSSPFYAYIATNITGRVYVLVQTPTNATEGALGTLHADNLRVTDYPATGATSWDIYNALVSTFPADMAQTAGLGAKDLRREKFDGVSEAARTMRSAVLNDGVDKQTLNNIPFNEDVPYLQTPVIETGLGEVSFWYRASRDNGENGDPPTLPAKITLMGRDQDGRWNPLTTANLHTNLDENPLYYEQVAAMEALTNIVETQWTYFNVEFYEKDYTALRIVAGDADTTAQSLAEPNRVMLDNVLITEPVRSSIDVGAIEFIPGVPLNTRPTDVKVTLVNPRMNPHDFEIYLDWFVSPGEPGEFEILHRTFVDHSDPIPRYRDIVLEDGRTVSALYYDYDNWTETNDTIEVTRVPDSLESNWGWTKWGGRAGGTIPFTNAPGSAYVFYSAEPIPTDALEPDTVVQYAVRVIYHGRFAKDVISETQGRVKNGYWFGNPAWYDPIDLNDAYGTTDRPSSHFFVFSCSTNLVRFNEYRPMMGQNATGFVLTQPNQFVELIGPARAQIGGWKVEHWGLANSVLDPDWVYYTNTLDARAVFKEDPNQSTNKGWGFYVLGCSAVDDRDEDLFSPEDEDASMANKTHAQGHHYLAPAQGALRLRRSMGAYVDKIAWGTARYTADLVDKGFVRMDYMRNYTYTTPAYILRTKSRIGNDLLWEDAASPTVNAYNILQEEELPWLDDTEEEEVVLADIAPPVIRNIQFVADGTALDIEFEVWATNGVALTDGSGYKWDLEGVESLEDGDWESMTTYYGVRMPSPIEAPETGEPVRYTVRVPVDPNDSVRFYRIKAKREE